MFAVEIDSGSFLARPSAVASSQSEVAEGS